MDDLALFQTVWRHVDRFSFIQLIAATLLRHRKLLEFVDRKKSLHYCPVLNLALKPAARKAGQDYSRCANSYCNRGPCDGVRPVSGSSSGLRLVNPSSVPCQKPMRSSPSFQQRE